MKNKLILTIIILSALAGVFFFSRFLLPSERGGREGFNNGDLSAQAAPAANRTGLTLDLNFGNNNGAAAPTVFDTSGFNNHATSTADTTAPVCGTTQCTFDGSNDLMTTNVTNLLNSSNLSYAIKFNPSTAANDSANHFLFDTSLSGRMMGVTHQNDNTLLVIIGGINFSIPLAAYQSYWRVGQQNILVVVGTTGNNKVWLNGVNIATDTTAWSSSNPSNLVIGNRISLSQYFNGKISYLKVWNRLLTDAEVATLSADRSAYVNSAPLTSSSTVGRLVGYWTMDAGDYNASTKAVLDKSGQNNTGTSANAATFVPGRIAQAMSFNGTSDYVTIPDLSTKISKNAGSVSLWAKHISSQNGAVVSLLSFSTYRPRIIVAYDALQVHWLGATGFPISNVYTNLYSFPMNVWHHVVFTWSGSNYSLYRDNGLLESGTGVVPADMTNGVEFMGGYTAGADPFSGSIDDVRIYNYAMSAQEVANLYNSAKQSYVGSTVRRTGLTLDLNFGNNNGAAVPTVYDSSGYGRNATSTAGATAPTCNNKSCNFNGSQYMTAGATNVFNSSNISIAIKFNPNFAANASIKGWGLMDTLTSGDRYMIYPVTDGANSYIWISLGNTVIANIPLSAYQSYWKVGQENIIIVVSSDATDRTDVYLNGNKILNQSTTAWTSANPTNMYIGSTSGGSNIFNGNIYYFKVWNRLLTNAEVDILSADRSGYMR